MVLGVNNNALTTLHLIYYIKNMTKVCQKTK
jgi:hypothetical protein